MIDLTQYIKESLSSDMKSNEISLSSDMKSNEISLSSDMKLDEASLLDDEDDLINDLDVHVNITRLKEIWREIFGLYKNEIEVLWEDLYKNKTLYTPSSVCEGLYVWGYKGKNYAIPVRGFKYHTLKLFQSELSEMIDKGLIFTVAPGVYMCDIGKIYIDNIYLNKEVMNLKHIPHIKPEMIYVSDLNKSIKFVTTTFSHQPTSIHCIDGADLTDIDLNSFKHDIRVVVTTNINIDNKIISKKQIKTFVSNKEVLQKMMEILSIKHVKQLYIKSNDVLKGRFIINNDQIEFKHI